MTHNKWSSKKPKFTEECILLTAYKNHRKEWDYRSWLIVKVDGEDENGKLGWYWGLCEMDGEEWGALDDMKQDKYMTIPFLK
jgi:hypothetical protein